MGKTAELVVTGLFAAIVVFIIFVKSGQATKVSGGAQTAQILSAGLGGLGAFGADLESGHAQKG